MLSIKKIENGKALEIKYASPIGLAIFLIVAYFIGVAFFAKFYGQALNIITILLPFILLFVYLNLKRRLKKAWIVLRKDDEFLYFESHMNKKEKNTQQIPLDANPVLIGLVNPPLFYYEIYIKAQDKFYILAPIVNTSVDYYAGLDTGERQLVKFFGYSKENIAKISEFTGLPAEIKSMAESTSFRYKFWKE
jgi:hypothetical protein